MYVNLNLLNLNSFFCVWLYNNRFVVNSNQRPNNSVPTSKSCEMNFFFRHDNRTV